MSDLLIKGVEIPNTCSKCFACKFDRLDLKLRCFITDEAIFFDATKKRAGNCPLINISPHGRLIDADKLCEYARNSTVGIDANDICGFPCVIESEEE